jgi:iron complex transport system ATP-binding protein
VSLEVENLCFNYNKGKQILDNVSFCASKGELIALVGVNGAGKTSLLKCICGIIKPSSGQIKFNGQLLNTMPLKKIAKNVSYFAQNPMYNDLVVFESILLARKPHINSSFNAKDYIKVQAIIEKLNLNHLALKKFNELSGGEAQKVRVAQLLAQETQLLLIDEPLNNLDLKNQIDTIRLIKDLVENTKLIAIMAIHDINIALNYAHRLIFLKNGKVIDFCKNTEANPHTIKEIYGIEFDFINSNNKTICIPI